MSYPAEMQRSIDKTNASRKQRIKESFPRLTPDEKSALLKAYHPDYRSTGMRTISVGVNKGDSAVQEFVDILEAHSRIDPRSIDLTGIDHEVDVLVLGAGGGGSTAALMAHDQGASVLPDARRACRYFLLSDCGRAFQLIPSIVGRLSCVF